MQESRFVSWSPYGQKPGLIPCLPILTCDCLDVSTPFEATGALLGLLVNGCVGAGLGFDIWNRARAEPVSCVKALCLVFSDSRLQLPASCIPPLLSMCSKCLSFGRNRTPHLNCCALGGKQNTLSTAFCSSPKPCTSIPMNSHWCPKESHIVAWSLLESQGPYPAASDVQENCENILGDSMVTLHLGTTVLESALIIPTFLWTRQRK